MISTDEKTIVLKIEFILQHNTNPKGHMEKTGRERERERERVTDFGSTRFLLE